jgi:hypothetical protein
MLNIIETYQEMERLVRSEMRSYAQETQSALDGWMRIDHEKFTLWEQNENDFDIKKTCKVFENAFHYITTVSTIIAGLAISSAAPVTAVFLVAAGGLGLLNRTLSNAGGWKWLASRFTASQELQSKIAVQIDTCLTVSAVLCSFASIANLYQTGTVRILAAGLEYRKVWQAISLTSWVVQSVFWLGYKIIDSKLTHINARLKQLETEGSLRQQEILHPTDNITQLMQLSENINQCIQQYI